METGLRVHLLLFHALRGGRDAVGVLVLLVALGRGDGCGLGLLRRWVERERTFGILRKGDICESAARRARTVEVTLPTL